MTTELTLYDYWRSSCAYRVRIALNLKGLAAEPVAVHLAKGEQHMANYAAINPSHAVPSLVLEDGEVLTQSLAILEYLEETYSEPPLLPREPLARARVRAMAQVIGCDVHPVNNLRVLQYLQKELGASDEQKQDWYQHWIARGFAVLEQMAAAHAGQCCYGDQVTLADICLVPQLYNARRFDCPLEGYPTLLRIEAHCLELPAFAAAVPEKQPDAVA